MQGGRSFEWRKTKGKKKDPPFKKKKTLLKWYTAKHQDQGLVPFNAFLCSKSLRNLQHPSLKNLARDYKTCGMQKHPFKDHFPGPVILFTLACPGENTMPDLNTGLHLSMQATARPLTNISTNHTWTKLRPAHLLWATYPTLTSAYWFISLLWIRNTPHHCTATKWKCSLVSLVNPMLKFNWMTLMHTQL